MSLHQLNWVGRQIRIKLTNISLALILSTSGLAGSAPLFFTETAYAVGSPIFVRPDGDDTCDGLVNVSSDSGSACAKKTIQAGIDTVDAGGTVTVMAGTYMGDVNINKSITLLGSQNGVNPNDGSWNDARTNTASESIIQGAVNLSLLNAIVLDGFTFERTSANEGHVLIGGGQPYGSGTNSNFNIRNNRFIGARSIGTPWAGIHTNFLNDATLPGAQFTAHQNRITIAGTSSGAGILVNNNTVGTDGLGSTTITGTYVANSPSNGFNINRPGASALISGNRLVNDDIFTFRANNTVITGNTVSDSPQTAISNTGGSTNWTASNNSIINPRAQAILAGSTNTVDSISGLTIQNNTITVNPSLVGVGITTVFSPLQYAFLDLRGTLTGTNLVNSNTLTLINNTLNPTVVNVYGLRVRANIGNLSVSNNVLSGNGVSGTGDATLPTTSGLFIDTDLLTSGLDLHVQNNSINGWSNAVSVFDTSPASYGNLPSGATIELFHNDLSGNSGFGVQNGAGEQITATANWWGSPLGPNSTDFNGGVTVSPWCSADNCSTTQAASGGTIALPVDQPLDLLDGTGLTVTLPNINDVVLNSSAGISAAIESGTVITASAATWDGTIIPPAVQPAASVTLPMLTGFTTTVATVIEIGSSTLSLTFDKPVRLLIPGQGNNKVGFIPAGSTTFTEITTPCTSDSLSDVTTQLAAPGVSDCKIKVGNDMVVWTKHFTKFVTYTQTVTLSPTLTSGTPTGSSTTSRGTFTPSFFSTTASNVLGSGSNETQTSSTNAEAENRSIAQTSPVKSSTGKLLGLVWYWWLVILLLAGATLYGIYRMADTTDHTR